MLIKALNAGLNCAQVAKLFAVQQSVLDVDKALAYIKSKTRLPKKGAVTALDHLEDLLEPQALAPKTLVCVNDCTIFNQDQVLLYFTFGRLLGVNVVFLAQRFTKVKATIRENTNAWVLWRQGFRGTQAVFKELGAAFNLHWDIFNFVKKYTAGKFQFVVYTGNRFYDDRLKLISETNSPKQNSALRGYLSENAGAFDVQQRNVDAQGQLRQSLLETAAYETQWEPKVNLLSTKKIVRQAELKQAQEADALKALTQEALPLADAVKR